MHRRRNKRHPPPTDQVLRELDLKVSSALDCCPNHKFTNFSKGVPQNGTPFIHLCRKVMNMDKHAERIEIFKSTLKLIEQGWYMTPSGEQMELPPAMWTIDESKMYSKPFVVDKPKFKKTTIRVKNMDCVEYAMTLIDRGYNPALLNLADLYTPGGLVEYGSGAQEENLCRRSNLVVSLYQFSEMRVRQYPSLNLDVSEDQYPMDERYGGIYSGCVGFFRGPESEGYPLLDDPYGISVISVAAIAGPRIGKDGMMPREEENLTLDKIRTIFRIGMDNGHDSLVLSAFGCGAFANPPAHIAKLFHQVMEEPEFKNAFRLIAFAILDGYRTGLRHNPEGNLLPFQKEFDCVPQNGTTAL